MCIRDLDDCSNQSGCPRPLHMMRYGIAHLSSIWPATVIKVVRFNWRSSSGKIVFFCMFSDTNTNHRQATESADCRDGTEVRCLSHV